MKQCIKYSIIVILAALLHKNATIAADMSCTPACNRTERCIVSQATTAQQAIRNFYDLYSSTSPCTEHVDHTLVPSDKSVLLRVFFYMMRQQARAPECDRLLYLSPHPVPDANYYVFGLRKIIV